MAKVIAIRRKQTIRITRADGRGVTVTGRSVVLRVKSSRKKRV